MTASYLPTLSSAPRSFLCPQRTSSLSSATGRRNPVFHPVKPAADCCSTKNPASAWTSARHERWEGDLAVEGQLPAWLKGTYLRNGPGVWEVGSTAMEHLFDGYATLVRVSFRDGRATGAHRQVDSDAYTSAKSHGRAIHREFAHCPTNNPNNNNNLLDRVIDLVGLVTGTSLTVNPNTAVARLSDGRVVCLSETTKSTTLIDPETLGTIGKFTYTDGLSGKSRLLQLLPLQSAHPVVTETEFMTVLPDLNSLVTRRRPGYLVVRMEAGSNERKVVGRVECRGGPTMPGWVHSFAVTENFVVVPEMALRYSAASLVNNSERASFYALDWIPESGSYLHVMCKRTGNTVASVEVPPFVVIHFINAYEEKRHDGQPTAVVVDGCDHNGDPAILDALTLHSLRSLRGKDVLPDARVARFRIPLDGSPYGELESALDPEEHGRAMDMCSINPAYHGKKYRYAYACGARRPCNFPNTIAKIDLVDKTAKSWHENGVVPSEPFFVARPGASDEDDGVVICTVNSDGGGSYTLVLDAEKFQEIARVRFPHSLPCGFHAFWIPDKM